MSLIILQSSFFVTNHRTRYLAISEKISNCLAPRFCSGDSKNFENPSSPAATLPLLKLLHDNFETFMYTLQIRVMASGGLDNQMACQILAANLRQVQKVSFCPCTALSGFSLKYLVDEEISSKCSGNNNDIDDKQPKKNESVQQPSLHNPFLIQRQQERTEKISNQLPSSSSFFKSFFFTHLTFLDLSFSYTSEDVGEIENIICKSPGARTSLRHLILRNCHDVGEYSLAAIAKNLHLETLNLNKCEDNITLRGIKAICDIKTSLLCKSLKTLCLRDNYYVSEKECIMEQICQNLFGLTSLDVSVCNQYDNLSPTCTSFIVDSEKCVFASKLTELVMQGSSVDETDFFTKLMNSKMKLLGNISNQVLYARHGLRKLDISYNRTFFSASQQTTKKSEKDVKMMLQIFRDFFSNPFVCNSLEELILVATDLIDEFFTETGLLENCKNLKLVDVSHSKGFTLNVGVRYIYTLLMNEKMKVIKNLLDDVVRWNLMEIEIKMFRCFDDGDEISLKKLERCKFSDCSNLLLRDLS